MHRENISCLPDTSTRGTETPKRVKQREENDGRTGNDKCLLRTVYLARKREREREERGGCVRTVIAMQWEQRTGHNGGEGGPPLHSGPRVSPLFPAHSSRFWPFSGAPPVRVHPAVVRNRRSGTVGSVVAAVVTMPPGVKAGPMCVTSRRALRCRRRCNLPDGYIHCYHAARLPGFSVRPLSFHIAVVVRRETTKAKASKKSDCARHSSSSIDDDEEEEAIASPEVGKLLAIIGKLRNANVAVIIRRTGV